MNKRRRYGSRKAGIGTMLTVIIGIVVFIFLFLISFNAVAKVFKSYKSSQESTDNLIIALNEVANKSGNIKMKLVSVNIEEGTSIYIFAKDKEEIYEYYMLSGPPIWNERAYDKTASYSVYKIIPRPPECPSKETCICLCNEMLQSFTKDVYKDTGKLATPLNCQKKIECKELKDVNIQENTDLIKVMGAANYANLLKRAEDASGDHSFIYRWEGGFSFWRYYKSPSSAQELVYGGYKYMIISRYADIFVTKNDDGTVKLCFTDECIKS
jgi:hypothetical protein